MQSDRSVPRPQASPSPQNFWSTRTFRLNFIGSPGLLHGNGEKEETEKNLKNKYLHSLPIS